MRNKRASEYGGGGDEQIFFYVNEKHVGACRNEATSS